jgi:hypothetical protein
LGATRGPVVGVSIISAPLYGVSGGVVLVAFAWVVGKLAAVSHAGAHLNAQSAVRFLLARLAVVYPYAVAVTALGYLSHLVLDSLTGPIPWWPFAHRRVALAPAARRVRTGSSIETWLVKAGDHDRCDPRVSRGRWNPFASALMRSALLRACTRFAV